MKLLVLVPILLSLLVLFQNPAANTENSPLSVVSFKWAHVRHDADAAENQAAAAPAQAMIPQNRNFARNARVNDPAGVRDPNSDTLDGRREALEKSVQESRSAKPKTTQGFSYKIKVQNTGSQVVEIVFWEYQFHDPADPSLVSRRQFLCGVNIPAEKSKELEAFSLSGPSDVVNVGTLANNAAKPFKEAVQINRIEYADGTIWQRKDWSLAEVKATYERVLRERWVPGMCKGL